MDHELLANIAILARNGLIVGSLVSMFSRGERGRSIAKLILKGLCEHHHANILHYLSEQEIQVRYSAGATGSRVISSPSDETDRPGIADL